jgi:superfamily II DNA or RNA helicase
MIQIEYMPIHCKVSSDNPKEFKLAEQLLNQELKVEIPGYRFMPSFLNGWTDGTRAFYSVDTHKFLSGLLSKVLRILAGAEFEVEINGYPEPLKNRAMEQPIKLRPDVTLYADQQHAVEKALKYRRGVWKMATNAGKTETSCGLIKAMGNPRAIVLVPRLEVFSQTVARFEKRMGVKPGMCGGGAWKPSPDKTTVAMFQTLRTRLKDRNVLSWLTSMQVTLIDECHFLSDAGYQKVAKLCGGDTRIGMSGTPFKENPIDTMTVRGICGPVLATVSNRELIEQGRSVKPKVVFLEPNMGELTGVEKKVIELGDWQMTLHNNSFRNALIADLATGMVESGRQTVVMVTKVEHGNMIHQMMPHATFTHASAPNRKKTLTRLKDGEVFCCICTAIFDTGLSVDHMECLINAAGGKAQHTLLQRLGRLLRRGDKQNETYYVDFWDTFNKITRDHSRDRWEIMKAEGVFDMMETSDCLPVEALTRVAESGSVQDVIHRKSRKQKWIGRF